MKIFYINTSILRYHYNLEIHMMLLLLESFLLNFVFLQSRYLSTADISDEPTKIYAIFFPQFHKDALNDKLWGDGFTDWNNLNNSQFNNRLGLPIIRPSEYLGFYDQTDFETRKKQGILAKSYNVDGFLFHHYWFNDPTVAKDPILAAPLLKMLTDNEPDIPFAINWVCEKWTAKWQGKGLQNDPDDSKLLIAQKFPPIDSDAVKNHFDFLKQFFHHKNYILVKNVPLLSVYYGKFPIPDALLQIIKYFKDKAMEFGFPSPGLHVIISYKHMSNNEMYKYNIAETHPYVTNDIEDGDLFYPYPKVIPQRSVKLPHYCKEKSYNPRATKPLYYSTITGFDNSPRRDFYHALLWQRLNMTVEFENKEYCLNFANSFQYDLILLQMFEKCCQNPELRDKGGKFILINAWNEWGEGMVLEPSDRYGYDYLKAVNNSKVFVDDINCNWEKFEIKLHSFLRRKNCQ